MRRQKTKIIILVIVLAILTVAVMFMRVSIRSEQKDTDVRMEENARTRMLVEFDAGDFNATALKVSVENGEESYTIEIRRGICKIPNFLKNRLNYEKLNLAVEKLMQAEVVQDFGMQKDLMQFGLEEGAPEVTVSHVGLAAADQTSSDLVNLEIGTSNQTAQSFRIGNILPRRSDECYVLCGGRVCVVKGFPKELCVGRKAFYRLELITVAPKSDESSEDVYCIDYLKLGGERFESEIDIVLSSLTSSGYLMEEPVYGEAMFAATDTATGNISIPDSLAYVEASSMVYESAGEDIIRECGLDTPYAFAKYSLNSEEHTIKVSSVCDGMRYLMIDEDPAVYQIEDIRVNAWAEAEVSDLRISYIWLAEITKLDTLVLTDKDDTYEFQVVGGQKDSGKDIRIYGKDKELDIVESFLPFYQKLLGMTILNTNKPSGWDEKPIYTVSYFYNDESDGEPIIIEFCREHDKGRYAALLNGRFVGTLRTDTVDEVMELAGKVYTNGESR